MSSTSAEFLTSESFPSLRGGSSASATKKATAWSKPLSMKAAVGEDRKVNEETQGQECVIVGKAEGNTPAKNPQEDSDQEGAKSADSEPVEQEVEQHTSAPWQSKPWRKAPAESKGDEGAAKIRPWSTAKASMADIDAGKEVKTLSKPWRKTATSAEVPSAQAEGDDEADEDVPRRPWKKSAASPWRKSKVEETPPESETEECKKLQDDEEAKENADQKAEKVAKDQEEQEMFEKTKKREEEQKKQAENVIKDAEERLQTEKAKKDEEERKKALEAKKDEDERIQAEKAKKGEGGNSRERRTESRRKEFAEKFKALKEAEPAAEETKEEKGTKAPTSSAGPALSGPPILAPGGKLTGSLTGSLKSPSLLYPISDTLKEKKKDNTEATDKKPTKEKESKDDDWRDLRCEQPVQGPVVLESSETSWAARQKQLREQKNQKGESKTDEEIVREMKSILNKLTIEKYDTLYQKMLSCGISTVEHVRILIHEVMEKATTQHHFIDMYSQFCSHLHEWFVENKVSKDKETSFKRILLNECQSAFERYLGQMPDLTGLDEQAQVEVKLKYKLTMLGNIKFVGALLQKKMLASSVLIACAEELVSEPSTPEALESLAAFLTSVGGAFDREDWSHHKRFNAVFEKMQKKMKDKTVPMRVRFLMQDVVDLRSTGWEDLKKATKKQEGPSKLADVEKKKEAEEKGESLDGFVTVSR